MRIPFFRQVAWYLVAAMCIIGIAPRADAGLSPSEVINAGIDRAADLAKVRQAIETKMVRERLGKLGFTPDEVSSRLNRLNDRQVHQLAQHLDDIKVGGDGAEFIIVLLIIAILVVILLQLTGHKVIVK